MVMNTNIISLITVIHLCVNINCQYHFALQNIHTVETHIKEPIFIRTLIILKEPFIRTLIAIPPSQLAEDGPRKVRNVLLLWLSHSIYVIHLLILILTWTCQDHYHWTLLTIKTWIGQNEIEMIKI